MKGLKEYILESKKVQPKTKYELMDIIRDEITQNGWECDLNHIDVSKITDMSNLFAGGYELKKGEWPLDKFNGDISKWNVKNVKNMMSMFSGSKFNGDISKWNVNSVRYMRSMFYCSAFEGNISKWKIDPDCDTNSMFYYSKIEEKNRPKLNK